jgi:tetratricopeptide (TPR) repeat protein
MSVILEPRIHRIRTLQRVYLELRRDLPFLEERIHLLRVVVADHSDLTGHPTTSHPALSEHCRDLGAALYDRYHHVRELEDLNEAAKFLRFALTLPHPLGKAAFPAPGSLLGSVLREHGHVTRNPQLCEEALSLHRQSMECSSNASTLEIAHHSRELGLTLRCHPSEDTRALSASVAHLKESRELYTDNQVTDHFSLLGLCEAMVSQYYAQPDKIYMDRAISYGELALTLCGSAHRDFFRISERLAYVHRGHAWLFENIESLDTSVVLSRTALLDASPRWTLLLALGLTSTLQVRFARLGHQEDLDEAVRCVTMLPKDTTPNDVDWCQLQDCTSWTMLLQFMTTGIPEHIEAAVYAADLACSAVTLVGSTRHLHTLQQSALCHTEQYNAFGDAAHLNKSIELLEYVMELAPPDSMNWRAAAKFILESLHERYKATGDTADLERAIALVPILQATRNKKELLASFELKVAGDVILSHYSVTGALADLDQATKIHWEAVQNCTSYRRHEVLCAYSATLRVRYEALLEKECAIEGLELQNQAYNDLPDVYPYRAGVLCGLSRWKLCISSGQPHVEEALDHLLAALDHSYSPAYQRLKDVSDVLSYLATRKAHLSHENASKLSFVYAAAIALLPQVASFGLEPRVRLAVISDAGQLTMQGAVHAIANEQLGLALEMLEAGRNVFWTQGLHLRTPFADLPDSMRDLLTKITYALARPFPDKLIGAKKDRELARRRRLGDDFRSALAEARQVPGCEDILLNASFESLVQVARHLTVILVASNSSGHAIVIREAQCHLVTLAQATTSTLQALSLRIGGHARAVRSSRGMRLVNTVKKDATAAYRELWTLVMQPIVAALQLSVSTATECGSIDMGLTH